MVLYIQSLEELLEEIFFPNNIKPNCIFTFSRGGLDKIKRCKRWSYKGSKMDAL